MTTRHIRRRRLGAGEPVHLLQPPASGAPESFSWRGRRHAIVKFLPVAADGAAGGSMMRPRLYQIETSEGLRVLVSAGPIGRPWRMEAVLGREGG